MGATYKWLGETGNRRLVVTNTVTKESVEVPLEQGLAAIDGSIGGTRGNTAGSVTREEFLVAKVVADKNGRVEEIKTWMTGGNRGSIIADLNEKLGDAKARLAEMEAKLKAAGLA